MDYSGVDGPLQPTATTHRGHSAKNLEFRLNSRARTARSILHMLPASATGRSHCSPARPAESGTTWLMESGVPDPAERMRDPEQPHGNHPIAGSGLSLESHSP